MAGSPVRTVVVAVSVTAGVIAAFQPSLLHAADMPSQYVRPGYAQPGVAELDKKKGKFEFFDVDNLAGMAGGAIAAGIADQRRKEYYRQDFFYGGRPYYGGHYYGGPAYYGGPYSTYYLKD